MYFASRENRASFNKFLLRGQIFHLPKRVALVKARLSSCYEVERLAKQLPLTLDHLFNKEFALKICAKVYDYDD